MKLNIKKLTSSAVALSLALTYPVCASDIEVSQTSNATHIMPLLSELKIMSGDENGDYRLGDTINRAEFTKIAVAASDFHNNAASNLSVSPFCDVPYTSWAAPYVRVGVTNDLVSGYPDATFRPGELVTYEEAVTIMLRVLGYSDSDFGDAWPYGQVGLAHNLGLTDNISDTTIGSYLTRSDAAVLVYNTLNTKKNNSVDKQISTFEAEIIDDVTLISTSKEDSSIPSDEVLTDNGTYKITDDFDYSAIGMKGELTVKNNKTVIGFMPNENETKSEQYAVYSVLSDSVVVYKNGMMSTLDIKNQTSVYDGKNKTTFSAIKSDMEMGDVLSVKTKNGNIDYIVYQKGNLDGPYTVGDDISNIGLSQDTTIMRDGKASNISDIQPYDIVYYISGLDMAFAYSTKVTGVYSKAIPNKDNPTEVEISGVTYKVESSQAFKKLSSSGSTNIGDTVTVMLGRTNAIADVMTNSSASTDIVGYIYDTGIKTYTTSDLKEYSNYYIDIVAPNGQTYNYPTSQNCDSYKNRVVKVSVKDGIAKISNINSPTLSGTFSWSNNTLGSTRLADNIKMLDIGTTDKSEPSLYTTVYPQRIDGININSNKILYYHKNSNGEIDELIFNDLTGDSFTYGIVTSATKSSMEMHASGSYSYIVNGTMYNYSNSSSMFNISAGEPVKLSTLTNPSLMLKLTKLDGKVTLTDAASLTCGGKEYPLSSSVQAYEKTYSSSTLYKLRPISDFINNSSYTLTAYYDKSPESGGRIRIIIASNRVGGYPLVE